MNKIRIILIISILFSIALSACDSTQSNNVVETKPKSITPPPTARPTTAPIQPGDLSAKPKCIYPPLNETPIPDWTNTP
jgi:hypothetical protein